MFERKTFWLAYYRYANMDEGYDKKLIYINLPYLLVSGPLKVLYWMIKIIKFQNIGFIQFAGRGKSWV